MIGKVAAAIEAAYDKAPAFQEIDWKAIAKEAILTLRDVPLKDLLAEMNRIADGEEQERANPPAD